MVLGPGKSGVMHVVLHIAGNSGTKVSGTIFVDTLDMAGPNAITYSGDVAAAIPYGYVIK
jgi:hypothetical protein